MNFILFFFLILFSFSSAFSHSGKTNSEGCHNQKSNNTYHCHNKKSSFKNNISSKNIKIIDGDTIVIEGTKIRFSGIDAPESFYKGKNQRCIFNDFIVNCGELAKKFLVELIDKKEVICKLEKNPDRYNRKLGECFIDGISISSLMVKNGYAFDYPKYSKKKFAKDQKHARENKLGLWKMKFEFPWNFREKIRKK